jgi:hypothetical protein
MHDSVRFETLGLPTAVVVTSEFVHEAHVQRAALGMNDLDPVVITHPLSTLTDAQIDQRIEEAVTMARQIWLGSS